MAELTPDKFKIIGFSQEDANRIDRPTISYWQDAWRRLKKNPVAMASMIVLGLLVIMVIVGPIMRGYDYETMNVAEKNLGPSSKYWFGTDNLGGGKGVSDHCAGSHCAEVGVRYGLRSFDGAFWRMGR